jgi:uncharacterized Zn finger protein (UPF0148 family)
MSEELKPCPFCGEKKTVHRKGNYQDELGIHDPGRVYCSICGGETSYYWWQKRPIEDKLRMQLDEAKYEAKLANEGFATIEKQDTILRKRLDSAKDAIKLALIELDGIDELSIEDIDKIKATLAEIEEVK